MPLSLPSFLSDALDPGGIDRAVVLIFGLLVPLAILAGRYAVKHLRQRVLLTLTELMRKSTDREPRLIPAFEFALQKYDLGAARPPVSCLPELVYYLATTAIF